MQKKLLTINHMISRRAVQALCVLIISHMAYLPTGSLAQDALRPLMDAQAQSSIQQALSQGEGAAKASSSGNMIELRGDGTTPPKNVSGRWAALVPHSTHDIIHSIKPKDVPYEKELLHNLHQALVVNIDGTSTNHAEFRKMKKQLLSETCTEVDNYLTHCANGTLTQQGLAQDSVIKLRRILTLKREQAQEANRVDTIRAIDILLDHIMAFAPYARPLVHPDPIGVVGDAQERLVAEATQQWQQFLSVKRELLQACALDDKKDLLQASARAFTHRIDALTNELNDLKKQNNPEQADECAYIEEVIAELKKAQQQCVTSCRDLEYKTITMSYFYPEIVNSMQDILCGFSDSDTATTYAQRAEREGKNPQEAVEALGARHAIAHIASVNRRAEDMLYALFEEAQETAREFKAKYEKAIEDNPDRAKGQRKLYLTMQDRALFVQDFLAHMHEVDTFSLHHHGNVNDNKIVFLQHEISVGDLFRLREQGVAGAIAWESTVASHWAIIAAQMGIPVLFLKARIAQQYVDTADKKRYQEQGIAIAEKELPALLEDIQVGDEVLLMTRHGEGLSEAAIRPTGKARQAYAQSTEEKRRYLRLCIENSMAGLTDRGDVDFEVYGNAASASDIDDIVCMNGRGVGLYRTEIALDVHATALKAFVNAMLDGDDADAQKHAKQFFIEHAEYLESLFGQIRDPQHNPYFVVRTFDIERDKGLHILDNPKIREQDKHLGFNLYTNPINNIHIGKEILIWQVAAYLRALSNIAQGDIENIGITPALILPMVGGDSDMEFIFNEAILEAQKRAGVTDEIVNMVRIGPMIEIPDAEISNTEQISLKSFGTSDYIAGIVADDFNIEPHEARGNPYFEKQFFELTPKTRKGMEAEAEKISKWNRSHPENIIRLGVCGELAGREKFALYLFYLAKKHKIPVYVSVAPEMIPIMKNFIRFITDNDIAIFGLFRRVTDKKADMQREIIYERIYQSTEYKAAVLSAADSGNVQTVALERLSPQKAHTALQKVSAGA